MHVNDLLKIAVDHGASDLHLKVGSFPMMRVRGALFPASEAKKLDHEDLVAMSAAVMSNSQRQKFKESQEVDLAYSVPGLGRFRCNIFQQRGTVGLVLRVIPMQIRTIDELGLPTVLKSIAGEERGLVLVTGTTGSGKSTTLAAMIDEINRSRSAHVMTVEDPIEFLHRDDRSMINQRESPSTRDRSRRRCAAPCVRTTTSSSSAKCGTTRPSRPGCSRPKPDTSSFRPCTPWMPPRRSTGSSPSFRRISRSRSGCRWRACSERSSRSA
jgi:hypothetical protein